MKKRGHGKKKKKKKKKKKDKIKEKSKHKNTGKRGKEEQRKKSAERTSEAIVTLAMDPATLDWFQRQGLDYLIRMSDVLSQYVRLQGDRQAASSPVIVSRSIPPAVSPQPDKPNGGAVDSLAFGLVPADAETTNQTDARAKDTASKEASDYMNSLNLLSNLCLRQGDYAQAFHYIEKAVRKYEQDQMNDQSEGSADPAPQKSTESLDSENSSDSQDSERSK